MLLPQLLKLFLIANNYTKKGIDDFIALANIYSNIEFHLVGEAKPLNTISPT